MRSGVIHEIKHDGYRLIVRRAGKEVRVFTRRGVEWTGRFPLIEDALRSLTAHYLKKAFSSRSMPIMMLPLF